MLYSQNGDPIVTIDSVSSPPYVYLLVEAKESAMRTFQLGVLVNDNKWSK